MYLNEKLCVLVQILSESKEKQRDENVFAVVVFLRT